MQHTTTETGNQEVDKQEARNPNRESHRQTEAPAPAGALRHTEIYRNDIPAARPRGSEAHKERRRYGELAQLARAPALHAGGQRFESVILHKRTKVIDMMEAQEQI